MDHKTFEVLEQELVAASELVAVGAQYVHYRSPSSRYLVAGLCIIEETDEVAIRYASLKQPRVEFIRSLSSWLSEIEWEGKTVERFRKV